MSHLSKDGKIRCSWVPVEDELYVAYHDREWGVPVRDDRRLFEMLCLEGAQAGLSWITILRRRDSYSRAFDNFDPVVMAAYDEQKKLELLQDVGIIRNRLKVEAFVLNARAYLELADEVGSFGSYLRELVGDESDGLRASELMSKELKKRGFRFVGPTICYAFMQAVGMVNDHDSACFRHGELSLFEDDAAG